LWRCGIAYLSYPIMQLAKEATQAHAQTRQL
jgi:hypothetical protein